MTRPIPPHAGQPTIRTGASSDRTAAAMILIHGRGATAANIITLAEQFEQPEFIYIAPQAKDDAWYPYSFRSNISDNEPGISSAFSIIDSLIETLRAEGLPLDRIMLLGFSQGACLALEYAARHAQKFGGVVGLSGALIGPDQTPRTYPGSLDGTPVFLGCSDVDPHIPEHRVEEASLVFRQLGGHVTRRFYHGLGHTVNDDEIDFIQDMMTGLL